MNWPIDLKLIWEIVVTALGGMGAFFGWMLFRTRKEGVSETESKQHIATLDKCVIGLEALTEAHNANAVRDSSIEASLMNYSERLIKAEGGVRAHDLAIGNLREDVAKLPTREEIRMLHAEIGSVRAAVSTVSGQLSGVSRSLDLINEHLLNRSA